MSQTPFTSQTIGFLKSLKRNNDRDWFLKNKERYLESVKLPSQAFLEAIAVPLRKAFPGIDVSKRSMYRIHRDTRFSKDKTPYKTHVGFLFRDRMVPGDLGPALYFGFDPTGFSLGTGVFQFEGTQRSHFRDQVTDDRKGQEFRRITQTLKKKGFELNGKALKKIPLGFDPEHINADFLLFNGCYTSKETDLLKVFYSPRFAEWLVSALLPTREFFLWMREMTRSAPRDPGRFLVEKSSDDAIV